MNKEDYIKFLDGKILENNRLIDDEFSDEPEIFIRENVYFRGLKNLIIDLL